MPRHFHHTLGTFCEDLVGVSRRVPHNAPDLLDEWNRDVFVEQIRH